MTEDDAQPSTLSLRGYGAALRHRWWVVLTSVCLGVAVAIAYVGLHHTRATASTLVRLNVISQEPFNASRDPSSLIDGETEVQTVRSSQVAAASAAALGGGFTPAEVRDATQAQLLANTTVLRISFTAGDATTAMTAADEVSRQFLAYRSKLASESLTRITDQLAQRRQVLQGQITSVSKQLAVLPARSDAAAQARASRDLLQGEMQALMSQIGSVASVDVSGGSVLTSAADIGAYVSPRRNLVLSIGMLVGLLLGALAALALGHGDRRIRRPRDVADASAGPVLARAPTPAPERGSSAALTDAVDSVREQLTALVDGQTSSLAVLEVTPDARPSSLAVHLAASLARTGAGVRLLLADGPAAGVETAYRTLAKVPHTDASGNGSVEVVVLPGDADGVAAALRHGPATGTVTVVALSAASGRAVRLLTARAVDTVVLVAAERATRLHALESSAADVRRVGAFIGGTVLLGHRDHVPDEPTHVASATEGGDAVALVAEGTR